MGFTTVIPLFLLIPFEKYKFVILFAFVSLLFGYAVLNTKPVFIRMDVLSSMEAEDTGLAFDISHEIAENGGAADVSISVSLNVETPPSEVTLDGISINFLFPIEFQPTNPELSNDSENGTIFDAPIIIETNNGWKSTVTLSDLSLNTNGNIFTFSIHYENFQEHTLNLSGEILGENKIVYDLDSLAYELNIPVNEPPVNPEEPAAPSGSNNGNGGGIIIKKKTESDTEIPQTNSCKDLKKSPFKDIEEHFAYDSINLLYSYYVLDGYSSNKFAPEKSITRAELVKMTLIGLNYYIPDNGVKTKFPDVKKTDWHSKYIFSASFNDIVSGYKDGLFRPNKKITRAEALKVIMFAAKYPINNFKTSTFPDVSKDKWYFHIINQGHENEIIKGYKNGEFGPDDTITRGQAAEILKKIMCNEKEKYIIPKKNIR